jgi:hypothetical protein
MVLVFPSARPCVDPADACEVGVLGAGATLVTCFFGGEVGCEPALLGAGDVGECDVGEIDVRRVFAGRAVDAGFDADGGAVRGVGACELASFGACEGIPGRAGSESNPPKTPTPRASSQASRSATPVAVVARTTRWRAGLSAANTAVGSCCAGCSIVIPKSIENVCSAWDSGLDATRDTVRA